MNFGKTIRQLRQIHHYTIRELAALAHMEPRALSDLESGRTQLSAFRAKTFADIFHISVNLFYELAEDPDDFVHHLRKGED